MEGAGPVSTVGNGDGVSGGDEPLLNCEHRRKSGQEALNIWRTGSQPSLAASQNEAQGSTIRLRAHTHTHFSEVKIKSLNTSEDEANCPHNTGE